MPPHTAQEPLTLRPLRPGDEEAAVRWGADAEFCRAAGWTPGLAGRVVRRHWQGIITGGAPNFRRLGVEYGGRLVGYVDLADLSALSGEFGIALGERALWGRGVGTRAGGLLLAHAFGDLGLQTVTAEVHQPNLPSHALMRRLGFRETGTGGPDGYRGEQVPTLWYALERADWAALSP
ncbi:GNAT family protein [Deinococcus sp. MIMF12]|uniref:GNAT family protein n=1 Tax=Deinococcus rhizophilus TaxID=3049544 RepID=A0ABT7JH37_9DEIO|nr:GNAT family protein [Deinococcus rhizophilus]MDL2344371.1 GNAT family protein [Deinococcus rhizophilus]